MDRAAKVERKTKETDILVELQLDGGEIVLDTGIGFFDHMLHAFAFYGGLGLTVQAKGDLQVDGHHTVEDVGIVLGEALRGAFGEKTGIRRFDSAYVPMDEALLFAALDVSGRPYLTLHMKAFYGANAHHITEGLFKALGLALKDAKRVEGGVVTSTKGVL